MAGIEDLLSGGSGGVQGLDPATPDTSVPALADPTAILNTPDPTPAIKAAIPVNPDKAAKNQALAKSTGLPVHAVEADPEQVEQFDKQQGINSLLIDKPVTSNFMSDLGNAQVSHDDVESLTKMETAGTKLQPKTPDDGFFQVIGKQLENAPAAFAKQGLGILQQAIENPMSSFPGLGLSDPLGNAIDAFGGEAGDRTKNVYAQKLQQMYQAVNKDMQANAPVTNNSKVNSYASDIVGGLINALPSLVTTLVTKNPVLGAGLMGLQAGGDKYAESRGDGRSPTQASTDATVTALANAIPAVLPLHNIVNASGAFLPSLLKTMGLDAVSNIMTQAVQSGYDKAILNKDMSWGEAWDAIERAGIVGAITGGGMHLLGSGYRATMDRTVDTSKQINDAGDEIKKTMESSPITQRAPDRQAQFQIQNFRENGLNQVGISPEALVAQANKEGVDPVDYMTKLGADKDQATEAIATGNDVSFDLEPFVNNIWMNKNLADTLQPDMRLHPDALTPNEVADYEKSGIQDEAKRIANAPVEETKVSPEQMKALTEAGFDNDAIRVMSAKDIADLTGIEAPKAPQVGYPLAVAEDQLGMQGLFKDAKEAGWTDKQYQDYLARMAQHRENAANAQWKTAINQELRDTNGKLKELNKDEFDNQKASIAQEPVYQAVNGIGRDRLDLEASKKLLGSKADTQDIEKIHAKDMFTRGKDNGIDPEVYANMYGYESALDMFGEMLHSPRLEDAASAATVKAMQDKHGGLLDSKAALEKAKENLHTDDMASALAMEANALRDAKKQGTLKTSVVRRAARDQIRENQKVGQVNPTRYAQTAARLGRQAAKALRAGNRDLAYKLKAQQVLNFHMAKESYAVRNKIAKDFKYLRKFSKPVTGLPTEYHEYINAAINDIQLGARISNRTKSKLFAAAMAEAMNEGRDIVAIPDVLVKLDQRFRDAGTSGVINYQDMKVEDWESVVSTVKELETLGKNANTMRNKAIKETAEEAANSLAQVLPDNIKEVEKAFGKDTSLQKLAKYGRSYVQLMWKGDYMWKALDGGKEFGRFYQLLKKPYDLAMSSGYGKKGGYVPRHHEEAGKMRKIWDKHFTQSELDHLLDRVHEVPGIPGQLSHMELLTMVMNMGNRYNLEALVNDKRGYINKNTVENVKSIATKRDFDFAQDMWNYLDTFKDEIRDKQEARTGQRPDMVEADPLETPYGTYPGGYYPAIYDLQKSVSPVGHVNVDEDITQSMHDKKFGNYAATHTFRGFINARKGSGGKAILLDMTALSRHVSGVLYDLEVGDALSDIRRVLYHRNTETAFKDLGRKDLHDTLKLWLDDQISGEVYSNDMVSKTFKFIRNGFTMSKLAYNMSTAGMQLLGVLQTGVVIGHENMLNGVWTITKGVQEGGLSVFKAINDESAFMAHQELTFNNNVADLQRVFDNSNLKRIVGSNVAHFAQVASVVALIKMQRLVNYITYAGAKGKALQELGLSDADAIQYAERAVVNAQGNGMLGNRSAFERGTLSPKIRQSEFVKIFTPLMSYQIAKANIALDRIGNTNYRSPGQIVHLMTDMAILYSLEGIITGLATGQLQQEKDKSKYIGMQTLQSLTAGAPFIGAAVQAVMGFDSGGAVNGAIASLRKASEGYNENNDVKLFTNANNVLGIFLHTPSAEINKIVRTVAKGKKHSLSPQEWLFGPTYQDR